MKISDLPNATPLTGAELLEISQALVSRRVTVADLLASPLPRMSPLIVNSEAAQESIVQYRTNGVIDGEIGVLPGGQFVMRTGAGLAQWMTAYPSKLVEFYGTTGHLNGTIDIVAKDAAQATVSLFLYEQTYGVVKGRVYWNRATEELILDKPGGATIYLGAVGTKFDTPVGFNNVAPVAKPTVTGSRGGNAALASLLTALAATGILTDSTTA